MNTDGHTGISVTEHFRSYQIAIHELLVFIFASIGEGQLTNGKLVQVKILVSPARITGFSNCPTPIWSRK